MSEHCRSCEDEVEPVVLENTGGRVGWFCHNCETLYPEEQISSSWLTITKDYE